MNSPSLSEARVTGTEINYLFVCVRKLWLFHHHIEMEHASDYVDLGQLLHEESYPREKTREALVDSLIRIDFIDKEGVLHDVKSSQSMEMAHTMQVLYYLYVLQQKGLPNRKGVINYPRQRRTTEVELTPEKQAEVEAAIQRVQQITDLPTPPKAEFIRLCRSCAYGELCWS